MLDICPVSAGDQVLDAGCGLGHEVRRLAQKVGSQGRVVGIDANTAMITEARRRAAGPALPISFDVGDAHQAGLPDGCFDLCRTERVLRYADRPQAVLAEMVRLTRPAGPCWPLTSAPIKPWLTGRARRWCTRSPPCWTRRCRTPGSAASSSGCSGRPALREVRVVPHAPCFCGPAGFAVYQRLNQGTINRAAETFFSAVLGFIAAGRKA